MKSDQQNPIHEVYQAICLPNDNESSKIGFRAERELDGEKKDKQNEIKK